MTVQAEAILETPELTVEGQEAVTAPKMKGAQHHDGTGQTSLLAGVLGRV